MRARQCALLLFSSCLLSACSDTTIPSPDPGYRSAVATLSAANPLAARVQVTAATADSAEVRYWVGGGTPIQAPAASFMGDTVVSIPVLGLEAATNYEIEVSLFRQSERFVVDTIMVASGSLPAWVPTIGVTGTDTTPGYLLVSLPGGPIIVDNSGKVVWAVTFPGGVLNSFQAHPAGVYSILGLLDPSPRFHLLNVLGEETGTLECKNGFKTRFHDFMISPGGDYWILCDDTRTMDLSGLGGDANAQVTGTVVQHIDTDGVVLFEWNAFDHFAITDLPLQDRMGPSVNFTHGNGIDLDTDGNLILSFRSLNEITKVNISTGAVMWRLGGLANEFTFVGDTKGSFERQHGVRRAEAGQIQMLDNGASVPSRFVTFQIDAVAKTATMVNEFIESPTTFTAVGGATQHYANGHAVVTFGQAGKVVEVNATGGRAWELTGLTGTYVFRVQRISSLYEAGLGEPYR